MISRIFSGRAGRKLTVLHNKGKYKHAGLVKEAIPMLPDIDRASRDEIRELTKTTSILKNIALNLVFLIALEMFGYIMASILAYILLLYSWEKAKLIVGIVLA